MLEEELKAINNRSGPQDQKPFMEPTTGDNVLNTVRELSITK